MTPTQLAALTALAGILEKMGSWHTASLVMLVAFLPDVIFVGIVIVQWNKHDKALAEIKKQHNEFITRYDNNIELVKQITKIADGLQDIVILNTQSMQGVRDAVDTNQWCPLVKKDGKVSVEVKHT